MTLTTSAMAVADPFVERGTPAPTVLGALQALAKLVGPADALATWSQAAAATDLHGMDLGATELLVIAEWLVDQGGLTRVAALSLRTRCHAHIVLDLKKKESS